MSGLFDELEIIEFAVNAIFLKQYIGSPYTWRGGARDRI